MHYDNGEEKAEPLVTFHHKIVGKGLSYLEIHDLSVIEDLDYIIGESSLSRLLGSR